MKEIIFTFCLLMAAMFLTAQDVPQAINFQAIARDANSEVLANTPIMIQLTILEGEPDGSQVYREIRSLTTNAYGSFSFQIGRDPYMAVGEFADIDWAGSRKFLKIDYDPTASLSFDLSLGTIEFVSVPYAFAAGSVSYIDATRANDGDVLAYNATTGRFEPVAMSIPDFEETDPTVSDWAKAETKPTYSYEEITGKPELFSGNYNDLTNKPTIPTVPTNVSAFENDANYVINETDPTIPDWAKTETKPSYSYEEITGKPELFSGNYNDLTNKPTIPTVPTLVSAFTNDANYISTETQTLADVAALGNSMNNTQIKNVATPTEDKDATTKKYVDDLIAALQAQNEALQETLSAVICNITFEANGGTGTMNPQTMVKGAAQAITTNTFTKENYTFAGWNTAADGSGTSYTDGQSITISGNMTLYAQWRDLRGILNGYEWVDLGLPSGLLWATCNVGAASPEEYGNYYAWGETSTKDSYTEENYTYSDNPETLPASADAATANWGEGWRMPTQTEMQELIDYCTHEWTTQNEVNGRLFTGRNGNSIFLPAAGYCDGSRLYGVGSYGYYRSSSLDSFLYFTSGFYHMRYYFRFCGHSVRPVCVQ